MKFNSKTITLTTDSIRDMHPFDSTTKFNKEKTELKAKALAILLGEYNKYGRNIDTERVTILIKKFEDVVREMKELIK